ncbi:MAG: response regulator, partial [bacterium]|nr:response regulator [bacterium]
MPISRKILVVEDDLTFANLTRGLLTSEKVKAAHEVSFEIDHAGDLASALKKLRSTEYDGIILDLSLPDCEGMQGLANITDLRNDIPVIVLTG